VADLLYKEPQNYGENEMPYDSRQDTLEHIEKVFQAIRVIRMELLDRSVQHDNSKLKEPEKSVIDEYTPKMKEMVYNSLEYKQCLQEMELMLEHHYSKNRHHVEYFSNGVNGMNLVDIVELFCDWYAAAQRNKGGDIYKSIEIGRGRFGISDQLINIFKNTVELFKNERI